MRVKWSQNFLADGNIARKIVAAAGIEPGDRVLEIGPGRGALTRLLLEAKPKLAAVEIDPELAGRLNAEFGGRGDFHLVRADFLEFDPSRLPGAKGRSYKVVGNLPYAVTSPILQRLIRWKGWSRAVVMVQKEVGERILAAPGGKDYGVLTVSLQVRCKVAKVCVVSRGCFRPVPQVDSMVLALEPLKKPLVPLSFEKPFFSVVRGAFAHRRKTILNSLSRELEGGPERLRQTLESAGIEPGARAETVSVESFARLARMLYNHKR